MNINIVGLNHRTTPVELRERFYLTGNALTGALIRLNEVVDEGVILSTCNRLEIYTVGESEAPLIDFLCTQYGMSEDEIRPHLYIMQGESVLTHLMRVACGLDSMILGETQILGQVSSALSAAQHTGTSKKILNRLFNAAQHAGKRARTETTISENTLSVSHAAATLIREQAGTHARVLVIGAGEMAEMAVIAAHSRGLENVAIINRTYQHGQALARRFDVDAYEWHELWDRLAEADAVISATGAPHLVLYANDLASVALRREGKPLVMVDIAVPRDIDPGAATVEGLSVYDIDDLQRTVDDTLAQRQACIPQVENIITQESESFNVWYSSREVVPVISGLRRKVEYVVNSEIDDALSRLEHLDASDQAVIQRLAHRIINKVLHEPTVSLREHAARGEGQQISRIVRDLFALEEAANS